MPFQFLSSSSASHQSVKENRILNNDQADKRAFLPLMLYQSDTHQKSICPVFQRDYQSRRSTPRQCARLNINVSPILLPEASLPLSEALESIRGFSFFFKKLKPRIL